MGYNNSSAIKAKLFGDYQEVYSRVVNNITYILYQDLTNPYEVLAVKRNQLNVDEMLITYYRDNVQTAADVDALISIITTLNYVNLIDLNK